LKVIKVSDNVYDILSDIAGKRGISINEVIQDIINVYLGGGSDKAIKQIIDKDITLLYDSKCSKCGKMLKSGDKAHYTKYVYEDGSGKSILLCPDCYINSDPLLYKKYMKIKEYEVIQKQLKSEIDRLVEELKRNELQVSIAGVRKEIINLWRDISFYLKSTDRDVGKYEELLGKLEEVVDKVIQLESMLKTQLSVKPKKEKQKAYW